MIDTEWRNRERGTGDGESGACAPNRRVARPAGKARALPARPWLEALEDRIVPTNTNAPWYSSLMAYEHYDSGRTHIFDQATFNGNMSGGNHVNAMTSPASYPAGYNAVYESSSAVFVYGGADPTSNFGKGSYVARIDPTTLQPVWTTTLDNIAQTGDWNWPGSVSLMSDGTLIAIYADHIARLDANTGAILGQASLPTGGWSAQNTAYNGLSAFPDGTLIAKPIYRPVNGQLPTSTVVVAINPGTLQVVSQVTLNDLIGGRISATTYNEQDYAYLAGNKTLYRLAWGNGQLLLDTSWAPGRIYLSGQVGASAPVIMNDWVVFQTDAQPSTTPLSVWAINQANASEQFSIEPFAQHPLLRGRSYSEPSSVSADPSSSLVYAADWGTGYLGAISVSASGLQVVWTAQQGTTEHMPLIGPAGQRVLVATSWPVSPFATTDTVVWRNAATGQVLAVSGTLPGVLHGGMVQPYYNGAMMYLGDNGTLEVLRPTAITKQAVTSTRLLVSAPGQPAKPAAVVSQNLEAVRPAERTPAHVATPDKPANPPAGETVHGAAVERVIDHIFADQAIPAPWIWQSWDADV